MKRIKGLIVTATLASIGWVVPATAIPTAAVGPQTSSAQKPPREQPSQPPAGLQGENQRQTVMLTGQIQQQNGEYVLSDSGVNYRLDPQGKVKRFDGQKVKVTGTLETATNLVHVDPD